MVLCESGSVVAHQTRLVVFACHICLHQDICIQFECKNGTGICWNQNCDVMIYIYYYYYIKNNALLLFTYRCFYTHMQRFFNIVLLEKCRDDIRANKKLNYHLYMALKKSLFKVELRCRIIVMIHHFIYFVPSYLSTYHIISRYLLISSPTCYTSHGTCCALL